MGASGKNWAHDYWYLHDEDVPDFVTFGGKSGLSGFYSTLNHRLNDEATSFSQSVNMAKVLHYGQTWKIIENEGLLDYTKDTSSFLKIELDRINRESGLISKSRGYGTHLAFDSDQADVLQRWLLKSGINMMKCGPRTLALRPSLTLGVRDAAQLREAINHFSPNFEHH